MFSRLLTTALALSFAAGPLTAFAADIAPGDATVISAPEDNGSIGVVMNQAKVIKLSRPAGTVIIGNPAIADATVRDATTIVLTGLDFGRTNMVVLDTAGQPVIDEMISVSRDATEILTVYRRANVQALSCEPICERAYLTNAERQSVNDVANANATGN